METINDILVLPFYGQGHLFPCVELSNQLVSNGNCKVVLIIPSHLSSSLPPHHDSVEVLEISTSGSPPPPLPGGSRNGLGPSFRPHPEMRAGIESFIEERYNIPGRIRPGCVVMDVMMSWSKEIFIKEKIPIVSFFTSGACSAALEYGAWKDKVSDMEPGQTRVLTGLPECLALGYAELQRRDPRRRGGHGHGHGHGFPTPQNKISGSAPGKDHPHGQSGARIGASGRPGDFAPPKPGDAPRWLDEAKDSTAILINTCSDLEGLFLDYLTGRVEKPVLGVGPLLPESYWKSIGSVIHDCETRPNKKSNYTEEEVVKWLDSKKGRYVIYVSFGSEVGPTLEEYAELAEALGDSDWPFIWVIQPGAGKPGGTGNLFGKNEPKDREEGYYPNGLEEKVGDRGLIIKGWAPQLLILSHPSTGGFLSHCGWNSTVETIGRGVPILTWPIRGDQFYDAKLVVDYLRIGLKVSSDGDFSKMVKKADIVKGIEGLMSDKEIHERAIRLRGIFEGGYPSSSVDAVKALIKTFSN